MKKSSKKTIKDFKNVKKQLLTKVQKSNLKGGKDIGTEDIIII